MTDERKASPEEMAEWERHAAEHRQELMTRSVSMLVDSIVFLEQSVGTMEHTIERQRQQIEEDKLLPRLQLDKDCVAMCGICAGRIDSQSVTKRLGRWMHNVGGVWHECAANNIRLYWEDQHQPRNLRKNE